MSNRVVTINISIVGTSKVRVEAGAKLLQVVGGASTFRMPSIVFEEPGLGGIAVERRFLTLASSLRAPESAKWCGSVRTGECEISHVYEVTDGP